MVKRLSHKIAQIIRNILSYEIGGEGQRRYFFETLAVMMASGIDIVSILNGMLDETKSLKTRKLISEIKAEVENGTPVWKVIQKHNLVSQHHLSLIRIGEESGRLAQSLNTVVAQLEKDREFRNKLRSASLYPAFVFVLLIVVGSVMLTFVLPRLAQVYSSLKVDLPGITQVMIVVGNFFGSYGTIVIPVGITILLVSFYVLFINKNTKHFGQYITLRVPGLDTIVQETEVSRFGYLMNNLLKEGIPIVESLRLLASSTDLKEYRELYTSLANFVEKGFTFEDIFSYYKKVNRYIPLYARQLLINGEKTGKLPENLKKIGEVYEKRNESSTKDIGTLLEPVLLLLVWVGVAAFALAVILPLYSLLGNLTSLSGGQNSTDTVNQINSQ